MQLYTPALPALELARLRKLRRHFRRSCGAEEEPRHARSRLRTSRRRLARLHIDAFADTPGPIATHADEVDLSKLDSSTSCRWIVSNVRSEECVD